MERWAHLGAARMSNMIFAYLRVLNTQYITQLFKSADKYVGADRLFAAATILIGRAGPAPTEFVSAW